MNSIKYLPIRMIKKGKTVGRPSKAEIVMSRLVSHEFTMPDFQKELDKTIQSAMLHGEGRIRVGWK